MPSLNDSARRHFILGAGGAFVLAATGCAALGRGAVETGYAAVPGGRLYYEVAGRGDPVVLVHGFTLDTRMWDDQFEELARSYRVVRYDLRGYGRSSLPVGPYSPAEDFKALLQHLGIARADVVGLSLGGRVALDFAMVHPELIRSLVLIDTAPVSGSAPAPVIGKLLGTIIAAGKQGRLDEARRVWLDAELFRPAARNPAVARRLEQMVRDYSGYRFANTDPEVAPTPPTGQRLGTIRIPTLVIVGELDVPELQTQSEMLAREIPGARKRVIQNAGHMSNMEAPAEVNRAVLEFLKTRP